MLDANGNDLTGSSHIGNRNPFRYRGYFYDVETGLYYLQTRYYDPEIGRFLNMDDISYADPEQFHGLNLYAYCGNDPVNYVDPTGHEWWEFWKWDWAKIGGWILVGAMTLIGGLGAIAGTFVIGGIAGAIIAGAGMGMLGGICSSIEQNGGLIHMSDMDPWKIAKAGGVAGLIGAATGALSYGVSILGQALGQTAGIVLGQASFLNMKIGKVFGYNLLSTFGKVTGGILGGLISSMITDFAVNKLTAKTNTSQEFFANLFNEQWFGWLGDLYKYLGLV